MLETHPGTLTVGSCRGRTNPENRWDGETTLTHGDAPIAGRMQTRHPRISMNLRRERATILDDRWYMGAPYDSSPLLLGNVIALIVQGRFEVMNQTNRSPFSRVSGSEPGRTWFLDQYLRRSSHTTCLRTQSLGDSNVHTGATVQARAHRL